LDTDDDFRGLTASDITNIKAAQVKLEERVIKSKEKYKRKLTKAVSRAKSGQTSLEYADQEVEDFNIDKASEEESSEDEEVHEEVFTLGRMNTQSQTQVNRYYTTAEIEADKGPNIDLTKEKTIIAIESNEEVDNEVPKFDKSEDDEDFNEIEDGDEDKGDENMH